MAEFSAISSLEVDIILSPEILHSQSHIGLENNGTIELDNVGNLSRNPVMEITLNNESTSLIITNQTNSESITITRDTPYVVGTIFKIYSDAVYIDNREILTTFTAPFIIEENKVNILQITTGDGITIDVQIQWVKPSPLQETMAYVQGFTLNEVRTQQKRQVNKLNKYTNGFINQEISYDFSIDHLYFKNYFPSQDIDTTYNIKYQTDSMSTDIQPQTIYLSGVSISSWGISQEEIGLVKEGVKGNCCKRFVG